MKIITLNDLRNKVAGVTPNNSKSEDLKTGHIARKYAEGKNAKVR